MAVGNALALGDRGCVGEDPFAIKHFLSGPVESRDVVPTLGDRHVVDRSGTPPKWMVTLPSSLLAAVTPLYEFAPTSLGSMNPSALYTVTDQNPSTGASFTVRKYGVLPSLSSGTPLTYMASFLGRPPHPYAVPRR